MLFLMCAQMQYTHRSSFLLSRERDREAIVCFLLLKLKSEQDTLALLRYRLPDAIYTPPVDALYSLLYKSRV